MLLAEDNETNSDVLQQQLALLGYASETAQDGIAALQLWHSGRFALLLTDCQMPGMDGFELTRSIRRLEPPGQRFPIIAVSASAMQGEAQRCLDQGMDDFLSKPLRLKDLQAMMARWLPQQAGPVIWDAQALHGLVGDEPAVQARLLGNFLRQANAQAQSLGRALAAGDLGGSAEAADTLGSAAHTVGAMALGALCDEFQQAARGADRQACDALAQRFDPALAGLTQVLSDRNATVH